MKTYTFEVIIEEDKWLDERIKDPVWRAYISSLVHQGASSWGYTQRETLKNLRDAVELRFEYLSEQGEEINLDSLLKHQEESSSESRLQIHVNDVPLIALTI